MYKIKGITDLMRLDGQECSCFGTQQQDQQFLAKQKTSTISSPTHATQANLPHGQHHQNKNGLKKSLRKAHTFHSQVGCSRSREGENRERMEVEHLQGWETHNFASHKNRTNHDFHAIFSPNVENQPHSQLGNHEVARNGHQMFQLRPVSMAESHSGSHFPCSPPAPALKITYCIPPPCFLTPQPRRVESHSTIDKTNSPKTQEITHQDLSISIAHSQLNDFDSLQFQQEYNEHHLSPNIFLKPNHYQSMQQPKKNQLLRMKDVVEICSQADSQSGSDSDNESIVVGRLHEYCSMLQPKCESSSTVQKSKGASAASSSISHFSFPRREALQH